MATPQHLANLEAKLTKEDWQFIELAARLRFDSARPKPSEGKPSQAFLDQEKRIMFFLMHKAFD